MTRFPRTALGVAAMLLSFAAVANADDAKGDKPFDDAAFVMKTSESGLFEVEAGKLATKMAKADAVKKAATMVVTDHTKANAELKEVAKAGGMKVAAKLSPKHVKALETFKGLKGEEFDKAYLAEMVEGHEMALKEFATASEKAKAPALKEFATKTLPSLKEHTDMVKKAQGDAK